MPALCHIVSRRRCRLVLLLVVVGLLIGFVAARADGDPEDEENTHAPALAPVKEAPELPADTVNEAWLGEVLHDDRLGHGAPQNSDDAADENDEAFLASLLEALIDQSHTENDGEHADDVVLTVEIEVGLDGDDADDDEDDEVQDTDADTGVRRAKPKPSWSELKPQPLSWSQLVSRLASAQCLQMPAWWPEDKPSTTADEAHASGADGRDAAADASGTDAARTVHHLSRFHPDAFCRRPIVLLSTWLTERPPASSPASPPRTQKSKNLSSGKTEDNERDGEEGSEGEAETRCASCDFLRNGLLRAMQAEMSMVFPSYATLVLIDDPMRHSMFRRPHIHLLPGLVPHAPDGEHDPAFAQHCRRQMRQYVESACARASHDHRRKPNTVAAARFRRDCTDTVVARVLGRIQSSTASPFAVGARAAEALVTASMWNTWTHEAFDAQGSYAVRALFLYPHNGSVMRHVVNEDVVNGDPAHVHFYLSAASFMRSVRKAIWTMQQLAAKGRLYD